MGQFTKRAQADKVPGLLRRAFTPASWKRSSMPAQSQTRRTRPFAAPG